MLLSLHKNRSFALNKYLVNVTRSVGFVFLNWSTFTEETLNTLYFVSITFRSVYKYTLSKALGWKISKYTRGQVGN